MGNTCDKVYQLYKEHQKKPGNLANDILSPSMKLYIYIYLLHDLDNKLTWTIEGEGNFVRTKQVVICLHL